MEGEEERSTVEEEEWLGSPFFPPLLEGEEGRGPSLPLASLFLRPKVFLYPFPLF